MFEVPVTSEMFCSFIENDVSQFIGTDTKCMIDNALIHHTDEARRTLELVFNGFWWYCSRYSPHLKPIEPCFALVKKFVKDHEYEATTDAGCIALIERAFTYYSVGEPGAASVRGHWDKYFTLHELYLADAN